MDEEATENAALVRAHVAKCGGLATLADLARRWGVAKSRTHELAQRDDFPSPVARVAAGTVALFAIGEADAWRMTPRPTGRPKREQPSESEPIPTMKRYVVVTRTKPPLPVKRCITIEEAGNYIVRETMYDQWTVLAQEANRITASTPYRELLLTEKQQLEKTLYPSLFETD